jgi:exodeoxyribonuclease VII small subunit
MAKKKNFEEYLAQVETLADELESGDLPLEEALKKYEEAIKALRLCQEMLKKAEQRIEVLLRDAEGKLEAHPFAPAGEPAPGVEGAGGTEERGDLTAEGSPDESEEKSDESASDEGEESDAPHGLFRS